MRFPNVDATVALNYEAGGWVTEGQLADPSAGDLLADTGQLAAGIYDFMIFHWASFTGARIDLEHRNAANDGTLAYQYLSLAVIDEMNIFPLLGLKLATNERLRIVMLSAQTGYTQCSIQYVKRV